MSDKPEIDTTEKTLDTKLEKILADPSCNEFIIADAKDADMAFGIPSTGPAVDGRHPSLAEYRQKMREIVEQGIVDIVIMSASNSEILAQEEGIYADTAITPAARANDTSDIWLARGSSYTDTASKPFRTATLDHILSGQRKSPSRKHFAGADLGLYSMTFNNDLEADIASLAAFKEFRLEAEKKNFRYFLEVFAPNVDGAVADEQVGHFINDNIARALAGVTKAGRPVFLKIPYCGPAAMEELVAYDPTLVPGILGGASGTTMDAFTLIAEAKKYGGRAALFGRKINNAEDQLLMVENLRHVADGNMDAVEATKAYHAGLKEKGIAPFRDAEEDSKITSPELQYLN